MTINNESVRRLGSLVLSTFWLLVAAGAGVCSDHQHHLSSLKLSAPQEVTHRSVSSGSWFSPETWNAGSVPGTQADVLVDSAHQVTYGGTTDVVLNSVQISGTLTFSTTTSSYMVVDTLIAHPGSTVEIGNYSEPIPAEVSVQIVVADPGPSHDFSQRGDSNELGLGLLFHGAVSVHGAVKAPYLAVAVDENTGRTVLPVGATTVRLQTADFDGQLLGVETWQVGDEIVVMGTARGEYQDELRVITEINGNEVTFDPPLAYAHDTPAFLRDNVAGIADLNIFVGNASRNVAFSSEYRSLENVKRRGHFMAMNSAMVDIRYAGFKDLGRTDKRQLINEAVDGPIGERDVEAARQEARAMAANFPYDRGNPEGRYSLHFHRLGTGPDRAPFIAIGNAVVGSPGWGITHHDSYGAVNWNFVYDVIGAGIASEDGNETGEWVGNFVTQVYGAPGRGDPGAIAVQQTGDTGFSGVAYESQSRIIAQKHNIAANARFGWSFVGIDTALGHAKALGRNVNSQDYQDQPYILNPSIVTASGPPLRQVQYNHKPQLMFGPMTAQFVDFSHNQMIAISETGLTSWHRKGPPLDTFEMLNQLDHVVAWRVAEAFNFVNYAGGYHVAKSLFVDVGTVIQVQEKSTKNHLVDSHLERVSRAYGLSSPKTINDQGVYFGNTEIDVELGVDGLSVPRSVPNVPAISYLPGDLIRFGHPYPQKTSPGSLTPLDHPSVAFNPDALEVGPRKGLELRGTVTDTLGDREFSWHRWFFDNGPDEIYGTTDDDIRVPGGHGHVARRPGTLGQGIPFPGADFMQWTEGSIAWDLMLDLYGAFQRNGDWVMPIPIWLNDLATGEPYPYLVDFAVSGADESDLLAHELSAYPAVDTETESFGNPNFRSDGTPESTRTYYTNAWRVNIPRAGFGPLFSDGFED